MFCWNGFSEIRHFVLDIFGKLLQKVKASFEFDAFCRNPANGVVFEKLFNCASFHWIDRMQLGFKEFMDIFILLVSSVQTQQTVKWINELPARNRYLKHLWEY